jgi:putative transposase
MTTVRRRAGWAVNRQRVRRRMRLRGLQSLAPDPDTSRAHPAHPVYPYLLRDSVVERPKQGWAPDITDIRIERGFAYLVAVMDWHSRKVLAGRLSNTRDTERCIAALQEALRSFRRPEIFNPDQGSHLTSRDFTGVLQAHGIRISMDGKGRAFDHLFVGRLWRSVKDEEVSLKHYQSMREAREGLAAYFRCYNTERPHQALDYRTPAEVYEAGGAPTPVAA